MNKKELLEEIKKGKKKPVDPAIEVERRIAALESDVIKLKKQLTALLEKFKRKQARY